MNPSPASSALSALSVTGTSIVADTENDSRPVEMESLAAQLVDIHRQAGHFVAELSEDRRWVEADRFTTRLISEAYAVAMRAGSLNSVDPPAVVRCRELAVAQRCLVRALESEGPVDLDVGTVVRARALLAELADLCATLRR